MELQCMATCSTGPPSRVLVTRRAMASTCHLCSAMAKCGEMMAGARRHRDGGIVGNRAACLDHICALRGTPEPDLDGDPLARASSRLIESVMRFGRRQRRQAYLTSLDGRPSRRPATVPGRSGPPRRVRNQGQRRCVPGPAPGRDCGLVDLSADGDQPNAAVHLHWDRARRRNMRL